jgi:hypothetical protein
MKKIKHSKFKNTGILFELLTRQITLEVLNGDKKENAKKIVQEFFKQGTELNKELRLYELLMNEKYNGESRAEKFIDTINEAHKKINNKKLNNEKYNLVKKINESFDMDSFLGSSVKNYKEYASIYKIFESKNQKNYDIKDVFDAKITIIENITSKRIKNKEIKEDKFLEFYKKQEKDVRLLSYKILIENFNNKYSKLDSNQKSILREYINNVNNTSNFNDFYKSKISEVIGEMSKLLKTIDDKVTKIKLKETMNVLNSQKIKREVKDNQVSVLMLGYELIKELKKINESK